MVDTRSERAARILQTIIYANLGTVDEDGAPRVSPVRYNYDPSLNIYWASDKANEHSRNIRRDPRLFLVIYDSTVPEGQGEGVYLQAKAYEVNDPEEVVAYRTIKKGSGAHDPKQFLGNAIRRVYKAVPEKVWMNDAEVNERGKFIRDYRVEVPLESIVEQLQSSHAYAQR
ncbi:pyridoxamine 5'-phosphate oxidase family protein [Candidatus Berkelbacteria bacterium]|nr:pyridoxamine 5'-phosphate oxidase family protein [Candidatus Berkelbacteria bacterium]